MGLLCYTIIRRVDKPYNKDVMQERLSPYKITAHLDIDTEDEETQSDRDYKRNMEAAQPYYKKINYHPPVEAPCNCNTDDL